MSVVSELRTSDEQLWCVHILGPDDVYPAPSKAEAERAVAHMQGFWQERHPADAALGMIGFEAMPWPYSPGSHAKSVGEFYTEIGMPPP